MSNSKKIKATAKLKLKIGRQVTNVGVYKATEEKEVERKTFHIKDDGAISTKTFCSYCKADVEADDITKKVLIDGALYELTDAQKDKILSPAKEIKVLHLIPESKAGSLSPGKNRYYIRPDKTLQDETIFNAIFDNLAERRQIAIVEYALKSTPCIGFLTSEGVLQSLLYTDETRQAPGMPTVQVPRPMYILISRIMNDKVTDNFEIKNTGPNKIYRKLQEQAKTKTAKTN